MSDVNSLVRAACGGDRKAAAELLPLVYNELRALAAARLAAEPNGHTLQPTALVHEAYLRLVGPADASRWDGRGHFYAAAAEAIRRVLIDHARAKQAAKRGRGQRVVEFDPDQLAGAELELDRWIDLDAVLTRFQAVDPGAAALANLRVFGGLSVEEAGEALGIPRATAFRTWTYARAWLTARLSERSAAETDDS